MELIETGASFKDANLRVWKMKEMICGPKVGPAEPACINNPTTGELITNKESIKATSLEHCAKILEKIKSETAIKSNSGPKKKNIVES